MSIIYVYLYAKCPLSTTVVFSYQLWTITLIRRVRWVINQQCSNWRVPLCCGETIVSPEHASKKRWKANKQTTCQKRCCHNATG